MMDHALKAGGPMDSKVVMFINLRSQWDQRTAGTAETETVSCEIRVLEADVETVQSQG